jgi:hypothetical protein
VSLRLTIDGGYTSLSVHTSDANLEFNYHPAKDNTPEFLVVGYWDSERAERVDVFFRDEQLDTLLEKAGVLAALRFSSKKEVQ